MAWIELHDTLPNHPKLLRLARELRVERPMALGYLVNLWTWALTYAEDGNLEKFDHVEIATAAGVPDSGKDAYGSAFCSAMARVGFFEKKGSKYSIHDWMDYAGRLVNRRERDRARHRESREAARTSDGRRGTSSSTVPNPTVPNPTQPERDAREASPARPTAVRPPYPAKPSKKWWPGVDAGRFRAKCKAPLTDIDIEEVQTEFPLLDVLTIAINGYLNHAVADKHRDLKRGLRNWCRNERPTSGKSSTHQGRSADSRLREVRRRNPQPQDLAGDDLTNA